MLNPHALAPPARALVAGQEGMVGRALTRALRARGVPLISAPRADFDLRDQAAVHRLFDAARPDLVLLAAARVGGIAANIAAPADFILDNLLIQTHVIEAALRFGVTRLLFLGSSCIYPTNAPLPLREHSLFTGPLEVTNAPYAAAKLAGIQLCQAINAQHGTRYRCVIPPNLYGPFDRFDPLRSHVVPALMLKLRDAIASNAPAITLWGDGSARRELLHVDDLADACVTLLLDHPPDAVPEVINVGAQQDLTVLDLAHLLRDISGFTGDILTDPDAPAGVRAKLLDASQITALGWRPQIPLRDGLSSTWAWLQRHLPLIEAGR
jgi:GDP-L-fucose synthase